VRLLIDTHALLWWLSDDPSLSAAARRAMAETSNVLLVSAASAWEIATKVRLGRLPGAAELAADFQGFMLREGFTTLDITADHGIRAGLLPGPHKDPFDRMLISQAQAENVPIVTNERTFETTAYAGFGESSSGAKDWALIAALVWNPLAKRFRQRSAESHWLYNIGRRRIPPCDRRFESLPVLPDRLSTLLSGLAIGFHSICLTTNSHPAWTMTNQQEEQG